ncbi:hypothetical protein StoSoilA2_15420 [Arthrobacter sp. StoSoilA2]|uniref:hypothetical protein n=1 Tax=Arthrobacter sp. StoSoilA2 TaxID=2830990 RepID=UPI001CC6E468|nr:hypothetical protein [Arthrobacter sp. StoSoilA2]BCW35486.1 hypothetical protein StoSoilA2_15420 [Arthrobacter sp. StoSoilA2]
MAAKYHPTLNAAALLFVYFAAMAGGIVELSIAAGYLTEDGAPGMVFAGVVALAAGLAFLAWSLWGLHRNSLVLRRLAFPALLVAAAAHITVLAGGLAASEGSLGMSHLAALGLTLMALAGGGWLCRQQKTNDGGAHGLPRTGRLLAAAFGAAVVVASVATPGLAASMAGQQAVPHGEHGLAPSDGTPSGLIPGGHHQK